MAEFVFKILTMLQIIALLIGTIKSTKAIKNRDHTAFWDVPIDLLIQIGGIELLKRIFAPI